MTLNDYEFQLTNTGVVLNSDDTGLPFVDVSRVAGLDSPEFRETYRDHEGTDGGFLDAEFERGRDIILYGTIYADPQDVETFLDSLKSNFAPVTTPVAFYIKTPGQSERIIFVKPRGVRYDWELLRRTGLTNAQFMLYAEDPRQYDNNLQSVVIPFGGAATTGFGFDNSKDGFDRTEVNQWGNLESGETWINAGGAPTNFSVALSDGNFIQSAVATTLFSTFGSYVNSDQISRIEIPAVATGGVMEFALVSRFADTNNYYHAVLSCTTAGQVDIILGKLVAGVATSLGSVTSAFAYGAATDVFIQLKTDGSTLLMKAWLSSASIPTDWQVVATDTSHTAAGGLGLKTRLSPGNTNTLPLTMPVENYKSLRGFGFNLSFGATVPASGGTVIVSGNRPTPAILTMTGPLVNPRVINTTDSKTLDFNITVNSGSTLVVDLANRTVELDGSNRRGTMTTTDWFLFNPGSTNIVFGGSSGTGTLTVSYRNAWR